MAKMIDRNSSELICSCLFYLHAKTFFHFHQEAEADCRGKQSGLKTVPVAILTSEPVSLTLRSNAEWSAVTGTWEQVDP